MGVKLKGDSTVIKALNNNMVLVKDKGIEKIILARGIGFNKKSGDIISENIDIDKIFSIEDEKNQMNLKEVYNRVDGEFVAVCEEAIAEICEELGEELNESIHIGLIDHLALAMKRLKNKEEISNPFIVEIETLYNVEFEMAKKIIKKIQRKYKVKFPQGEIGFITLHIHSARKGNKLSNTITYSYLANRIVSCIEGAFDSKINKKSLDYARFLAHIRFTIERILTDTILNNDLIDVIKKSYPQSYEIAEESARIIEETLNKKVIEDEIAYITMHIERFRVSMKKKK
ncbi:PRD domain-containing protein [Clostridium sp. D53t1_180928_C8]|uniref:PRD domain-containing protein n=1 Tax=Clostridium sp. D53t1_180928_C8 TaxID=2787101 RepID=UPI0018A9571A